jgi:hypothetical protein
MLRWAGSVAARAWQWIMPVISVPAIIVIFVLNKTMSPQRRTGRPDLRALLVWAAVNVAVLVACTLYIQSRSQIGVGFGLAAVHFLIIVAALLVISEENDVWNGFVRYNRSAGAGARGEQADCRRFKKGKIVKSLPLMAMSSVFYLVFVAVGIRGVHSQSSILNELYSPSIPVWRYVAMVSVQVPIFETLVHLIAKWTSLPGTMEFRGLTGRAIELFVNVTNASIVVSTFNSYVRQKSQIRRLVEGMSSERADIPFLQLQAARAPEEIKSAIIDMAVAHPEARIRWCSMEIARRMNILTFPHTLIHNLHHEAVERNKRRAIAVSIDIVRDSGNDFEPSFRRLLQQKIKSQLVDHRARHTAHVLNMLVELGSTLKEPIGQKSA